MVLPLLMMGAGAGLQMYGQNARGNAQDLARDKYGFASRFANQGNERDTAWAGQGLDNLGRQWNASNDQAVNDNSSANMRGNYGAGQGQLQQSIANLTASTPQAGQDALAGAADNVSFQNAMHRQASSNAVRTQGLQGVLENNAGLDHMNQGYSNAMGAKGDRDMMIQARINSIMKLQNYSQAVRQAALQRAGADHGLDQARAASVGSGAMYLGALMGAGGSMYGGMSGGGQAAGSTPFTSAGGNQQGLPGGRNPQQ